MRAHLDSLPPNAPRGKTPPPLFSESPPSLPYVAYFSGGLALSDAFEERLRRLRLTQRVMGDIRLQPHTDRQFVRAQRLSQDGTEEPTFLVSDTICRCGQGAEPEKTCPHRDALRQIGGVDVFYRDVAALLQNPDLARCAHCTDLLDGEKDALATGLCFRCTPKTLRQRFAKKAGDQ